MLIAPRIRAVQPAFINSTEPTIKVYFTLQDALLDTDEICCSLVDPNIKSTWDNNTLYTTDLIYVQYDGSSDTYYRAQKIQDCTNQDGGEMCLSIVYGVNMFSDNPMTNNQYYQVQLWTKSSDETSPKSQVTLIRPIAQPTVHVNNFSIFDEEVIGYITYSDNSTVETLDSCRLNLYEKNSDIKVATIEGSCSGLNFTIPLKDMIWTNGVQYQYTLEYTTINGYKDEQQTKTDVTGGVAAVPSLDKVTVELTDRGSVIISALMADGIQKSTDGIHWQTIYRK